MARLPSLHHLDTVIATRYGLMLLVKTCLAMQEKQETGVQSLGWENPLEEGMATHSSILAWEILWAEESGGLQSIESYSWTRLT